MPRCPVCKKALSEREFAKALGILEARDQHAAHQTDLLRRQLEAAKAGAKRSRDEGIKAERARNSRLLKGKESVIQNLKEKLRHVQRGTTPQTDGLEFEERLVERLHREFPGDTVTHAGKRGDVLHEVAVDGRSVGTIVYECKRTPKIASDHIAQCQRARRERCAHYAVLVTTGTRRGFSGLGREGDVVIVAPLGVVALATLLRGYLLEMERVRVERQHRNKVALSLLDFVTDNAFRRPVEQVITTAKLLITEMNGEVRDHIRVWQRRLEHYTTIGFETEVLRENVAKVLRGKQPRKIAAPPRAKLMLPSRTG